MFSFLNTVYINVTQYMQSIITNGVHNPEYKHSHDTQHDKESSHSNNVITWLHKVMTTKSSQQVEQTTSFRQLTDCIARTDHQTHDTQAQITRNVRQCDGRPAEYRWRPLFNAAKFGWRPLLEYCAVTLPGSETHWNYQGCHKLPDRSQPLVGQSSPYCDDIWRRYCCLTSFFPIVDTCLCCKDIARQKLCGGAQMANFCVLYFHRAASSTFQTCILNSHHV